MVLLGRLAIPLHCLCLILWKPGAMVAAHCKVELRFSIPLLGRFAIQADGFLVIRRHPLALLVKGPQQELRIGVAAPRGLLEVIRRERVVQGHALAARVEVAELVLGVRVALLSFKRVFEKA